MITREQVTWLWLNGCNNNQIANRLGISRQRVSQILTIPPTWRPRKPGRKPVPLELLEYRPEPRQHFRRQQIPRVKAILRSRSTWTWVEAEAELLRYNLKPPARNIHDFLRDVGFRWNPKRARWVKDQGDE
jgi:transposase